MRGTNACYSCGKPGHMVKDCPIRRSLEQGKERVQSNGPSEESNELFLSVAYLLNVRWLMMNNYEILIMLSKYD